MGGQPTVLAIAHPLAVDPEIEGRLHALEVHDDVHALPLLGHGKLMHIMAHGIVILWHQWRVGLEGIGNVGIDGRVESLQFPTARHLYVLPSAHVVGGLEEIGEGQAGALHQFEFPHTVERPAAFRLGVQLEALGVVHAQLGQGAALRGEGQVVGRHGHAVDVGHGGVLPGVGGRSLLTVLGRRGHRRMGAAEAEAHDE